MKTSVITSLFLLIANCCFCQVWTAAQLNEANTAADLEYLSAPEKQVILYINLCRLYPQQFAANEVKKYKGVPG
ncbi:MAG: hypothetical protein IPP72_14465 [Chitinophagaceae bacterium]|nr:hypothetical protein [Chitinophagaceae bacterium]